MLMDGDTKKHCTMLMDGDTKKHCTMLMDGDTKHPAIFLLIVPGWKRSQIGFLTLAEFSIWEVSQICQV